MLLSLIQQGETDLQTHHYQNTCHFTPSTQPTFSQRLAPPPAHLMLPPKPLPPHLMLPSGPPSAHLMQPEPLPLLTLPSGPPSAHHWMLPPAGTTPLPPSGLPHRPPPPHLMLPARPLVPSFPQPSYRPPFAASIQPYAIPVPPQFTISPLTQPYAISSVPPLSFAPPQTVKDLISYLANAILYLSAKNMPYSVEKKIFHQITCLFLQQVYTIGSFKIPMCDSLYIWHTCAEKFGSVVFEDYFHHDYFFLSNSFTCKKYFSINSQKTSWLSVVALIAAKKLDYFSPLLPENLKQNIFSKLQQCDQKNHSHASLTILKHFQEEIKKEHSFNKERWKKVAVIFLFHALYCKFDSNPDLKEQLLQTEQKIILYQNSYQFFQPKAPYTHNCYFWGVDITHGIGYNVMGNLLGLVREYIREKKILPTLVHDIK